MLGMQEDALGAELEKISCRGQIAFAAACADWVVAATSAAVQDPIFGEYVASWWAVLAGFEGGMAWQPDAAAWDGRAYDAQRVACSLLTDTWYATGQLGAHWDAALCANLVRHVLAADAVALEAFETWRAAVIPRLLRSHPWRELEPHAGLVTVEDMTPGRPVLSDQERAASAEAWRAALSSKPNRFLGTAAA
jgi:hypothetical protein